MAISVGNLVVKNNPLPAPVPTPVEEVKKEPGLLARFYKESRYTKDMINN